MGVVSWSWCRGWVVASTEHDLREATDEVNQILLVAFENAGIKPIDMQDASLRVRYRAVDHRGFKFNVYEVWDEIIAANREYLRQIPLSDALDKVWRMMVTDIYKYLVKEYGRYGDAVTDGTLACAYKALLRANDSNKDLDQDTISALFGDMISVGYANAAKHGTPSLEDVDRHARLYTSRILFKLTYNVKLNHLSNNRISWNGRIYKTE